MGELSAKNKIIILLVLWLAVSASMFLFFFQILDNASQRILSGMSQQMQNLAVLKNQNQNYQQAQADLDKLAQEPLQPEDFFSKDVTLVNDIEVLQNLGAKLNVDMTIDGITGTVNTASTANTATPMVKIPYSVSINGSLKQVLAAIETLENLSFITDAELSNISSSGSGKVSASLTANFYVLK